MKNLVKKMFSKLPLKTKVAFKNLVQSSFSEKERLALGGNNTFLSLNRLLSYGYRPDYIIDVGAYHGEWTKEVYKIFPQAKFIAVEPLPNKKIILEQAFANMPVKLYSNAVGESNKKNVSFYSMETGSSMLQELTNFSREVIHIDMTTLDMIAANEELRGSVLLKLDVQGFELEVLKGATSLLNITDVICMECSFLNYNEGAPLAHEVIQKMNELNFCIFDITEFHRKSTDFALVQSDFIFIKANSAIRNKANDLKKEFKMVDISY